MNPLETRLRTILRGGEEGFTMIMTVIGLALVALLAAVAVAAVQGDSHMTYRDFTRKQAYEAAKAGLDEYAFHLHKDNGYWAKCTEVASPSAVNQQGSTANRRTVPGTTNASYAVELLPATGSGYETCDSSSISTATASMLQSSGAMKGTFRVRSTGFVGESHVSITATFKPASFLDYVYFTQLETSDPVTYGDEETIKGAYEQCSKTIVEGRYEQAIPNSHGKYCDVISFVSGDYIKGPMHTNDAFVICGSPTLGRNANDPIEVSSPPKGWYSTSELSGYNCTGNPNFAGTFTTNSPALLPPATNEKLATLAEPQFKFQGQVRICLSGSSMTVRTGAETCSGGTVLYSGPQPANGIVYVENISCTGAYSPFETQYPTTSECGNVYVHGNYSKPLTIAAGNDIVIDGNIDQEGEEGVLGLIANNFIRIYHPVEQYVWYDYWGRKHTECRNVPGTGLENVHIDAAILAINHSFIVDSYNCGEDLGTLTVHGAIAQKYRGAVGTSGGTGYLKNYEYDERLHTIAPPSFIEPVQSDWVIGRETVG